MAVREFSLVMGEKGIFLWEELGNYDLRHVVSQEDLTKVAIAIDQQPNLSHDIEAFYRMLYANPLVHDLFFIRSSMQCTMTYCAYMFGVRRAPTFTRT